MRGNVSARSIQTTVGWKMCDNCFQEVGGTLKEVGKYWNKGFCIKSTMGERKYTLLLEVATSCLFSNKALMRLLKGVYPTIKIPSHQKEKISLGKLWWDYLQCRYLLVDAIVLWILTVLRQKALLLFKAVRQFLF